MKKSKGHTGGLSELENSGVVMETTRKSGNLKNKPIKEGYSEVSEKIGQLKFQGEARKRSRYIL